MADTENLEKAASAARTAKKAKPAGVRTRGDVTAAVPKPSDIKIDIDTSQWGPTAFAATPVGDITGYYESQEFVIDEEKSMFLHFTEPGLNIAKKRSYVVKAFKPDGTLVQLGFEPQIENTAASSREDAIGLRRAQQRGFTILYDFNTGLPVYCATWDCWAKARDGEHFCSDAHASYSAPTERESSSGATTSRVWSP